MAQMASTLEDAAAVLALVALEPESRADVSEALGQEAAALVALAGRLEEAADRGCGDPFSPPPGPDRERSLDS